MMKITISHQMVAIFDGDDQDVRTEIEETLGFELTDEEWNDDTSLEEILEDDFPTSELELEDEEIDIERGED